MGKYRPEKTPYFDTFHGVTFATLLPCEHIQRYCVLHKQIKICMN